MKRRQFLGFGMGLALAPLSVRAVDAPLQWRERMLQGFGTTLWLRAAHADGGRVEQALDRAAARLKRIESQMSLFDPDSALSRLNRHGLLERPDADLLAVLQLAQRIAASSGGSFDVSMQPLWQVWEAAAREGRLPAAVEVAAARAQIGWKAIEIAPQRLLLPKGFALSLNGIAQGYAADAVRAELRAAGIRHAMLDTGETALLGQGPGGAPWRLGVAPAAMTGSVPDAARMLAPPEGFAVATSSDDHTRFSPDRRHHHIVDPRSGYSPPHWSSVTVVTRSAALADGLTKVFFMLPTAQVEAAARRWDVSLVLQDKAGRWISV